MFERNNDLERKQLAPGVCITTLDASKFNRCRITLHLRFPAKRESATDAAVLALVLERGYAACPDMTALSRRLAELMQSRTEVFNRVPDMVRFLAELPDYDLELYTHKKMKSNPQVAMQSLQLCRPVLEFASMPVWTDDFAPHDVGRYPNATGQVYAARRQVRNGETHPPYYLYPAGAPVYDPRYQMPVEECGNMLVMLAAAQAFGASEGLARAYRPLLDKWVGYLVTYGEDPGEQLCTDDFAGHLAHNVNLAAKAMVGVACYGRLTGDASWEDKAREMAARFLEKVGAQGNTPLTLDGQGWSMKYNLLWDRVLHLGLLPDGFYDAELNSYLPRINAYGLPLDSRADYTKSDWICWTAALTQDKALRQALLSPIARMLRETTSRVPFSDWYDTKTGRYQAFIARSVQGGIYAPLLRG